MLVKPNKDLGQHYLIDESILKDIAALVPENKTRYIEIGPGTGNLTRYLVKKCQPLTCIELDRRFKPIPGTNWTNCDAMEYDYKPSDWIVGNLPYNISGAFFQKVCEVGIDGWTVMVQKEVAERVMATRGKEYGRLSLLVQAQFDVSYHFTVAPYAFNPAPKVYSAVISGTKIPSRCNLNKLEELTRKVFMHRRKQIKTGVHIDVLEQLLAQGISATARPEEVPMEIFWKLC